MRYLSKASKLHVAIVISNLLEFSKKYKLKLTDDEVKNIKDYYGLRIQRLVIVELTGKESNWLRYLEDSIYQAHLVELIVNTPKIVALKSIIDQLE